MLNKFKYAITSLLAVLMAFAFVGCETKNPLDQYAQLQAPNNTTVYNLPPSGLDGINGVDGKDGKDGDSIDLYEVYEKLVELGEFSGTYSEFVKEYLSTTPDQTGANKAINSVVSVFAGFTSLVTYTTPNMQTGLFQQKYYGAGSGVIFRIDKETGDALIITNYHVCYDHESSPRISQDISLFLYGNESYAIRTEQAVSDMWNTYKYQNLISDYKIPATYLGGSMTYDIAVLKVSGSELLKNSNAEAAPFANSNEISVGETVIAIGNPSGSGLSVTKGIVSVDSEYISMIGPDNMTACQFRVMRTDTPINSGNSGGGLFNEDGELIGIVNAKIINSSIENIGYAIPSNVAAYVATNIIKNCNGLDNRTVKRCIIGISVVAESSSAVSKYTEKGYKTEIVDKVVIAATPENPDIAAMFAIGDTLKQLTIEYQDGTTITQEITRTFQLVDLSLTLSVGDKLTISLVDSNGAPKADAVITFTQDHITEYK